MLQHMIILWFMAVVRTQGIGYKIMQLRWPETEHNLLFYKTDHNGSVYNKINN